MNTRSTLCVHVGQCGAQLGAEFWSLNANYHATAAHHGELSALVSSSLIQGKQKETINAVVIDAEPKVASRFEETFRRYSPSIVYGQSGMGSCWAAGYGCHSSERAMLLEDTLECFRRRLETYPCSSLLFTCSLSGGTGSGVTSALLQHCADLYPSITRVVVGVLPFERGDNPLKHYNTILSTQYLYEYSDAVFLRTNDLLAREANATVTRDKPTQTPPPSERLLALMNQTLASDMTSLFARGPVHGDTRFAETAADESFRPYHTSLEDIVSTVCVGRSIGDSSVDVHSSAKTDLLNGRGAKATETDENSACGGLGRALWHLNQHLRGTPYANRSWRPCRLQLRTLQFNTCDRAVLHKAMSKMEPLIHVPPEDCVQLLQCRATRQTAPEVAVVAQSPWIAADLSKHAIRATEMLKVRAFIHWYEREGCSEVDVHSALGSVQEQLRNAELYYLDRHERATVTAIR